VLTCFALAAPTQAHEASSGWVPYLNERFGFSFRYPAGMFEPERRTEAGDGENYVRRDSYSGYDLDYARRGQTWFVLAGENDQNVFYEKVIFSCSGRIISSFALIYPIARKVVFDRVVEGIEKTFRPAQNCEQYARQP